MSLIQVLGALLIFVFCPLLGGLPLTGWIIWLGTGQRLRRVGTGNVSVSAAFYHGGTGLGLLAVAAEAFKGVAAVVLAQYFFPGDPIWPVIALIALVMGRYWLAQGAGVTNVMWGFILYDPIVTGVTFLLSLMSFTLIRERKQGRWLVLILLPVVTGLLHGDGSQVLIVACLTGIIGWIYQKLPDDLTLPTDGGRVESQPFFKFFRGEQALKSLSQVLKPEQVGSKAATLSQLKAWGYPVPMGYVLQAGDDPVALVALTQPTPTQPVVVRSSAVGEDGLMASAAGQYVSVLDVTSQAALMGAIATCFDAYNAPAAVRYRQDRGLPEATMNVLVQQQVQGVFSGVAFSRDPIARYGEAVVVEALPGGASSVVSGQVTPQRFRVLITGTDLQPGDNWQLPTALTLSVEGEGTVPTQLVQQVAYLTRHLEQSFHSIPQDVEWSYDGEQLWVLQSRPITTLVPIWTRKIAAEVIPGVIRPLTWSINRPLTCGVWGKLFSIVLGQRAAGLDFEQTATLHFGYAYFNASLLADLFRRMGLPAESLEFLTRGAKFTRPSLASTLRNLPGLARLASREWTLIQDFKRDNQRHFQPGLTELTQQPAASLTDSQRQQQIETILTLLDRATYYTILAPLSLALRQALLKVENTALDNQSNPEIAALTALRTLANHYRPQLIDLEPLPETGPTLRARLSEHPIGQQLLSELDHFLDIYGYLSEVATDIAIPTWQENPTPIDTLLAQFLLTPLPPHPPSPSPSPTWKTQQIQSRLNLKGQVSEVYNRLLAHLRAAFVAQETAWLATGQLQKPGDIFFLTWAEIQSQLAGSPNPAAFTDIIEHRQTLWQQNSQQPRVPYLVYGNVPIEGGTETSDWLPSETVLKGIGASPGQLEGEIRILTTLETTLALNKQTILVVPYTDAGWAPLLAQIGGLISEVGGQLSHGAIVAREYGIPAVMDVTDATHRLTNGQRVRLDGQQGVVEILS